MYYMSTITLEGVNVKQYRVTVWASNHTNKKYCYVVGLSDPDSYKEQLKMLYNRFTIEDTGRTL
jgi:hypothetical protein